MCEEGGVVEGELAPPRHSASHLGKKHTSECPGLLTSKPDYLVRIQIKTALCAPTPPPLMSGQSRKRNLFGYLPPRVWFRDLSLPEVFLPSPFPLSLSYTFCPGVNNAGTSPRHGSLVSGLCLCCCPPETKLHYCQTNQRKNTFSQCWMPGPLELIISFRKHFYNLGRNQGRTAVYIKNTGIFPYLKQGRPGTPKHFSCKVIEVSLEKL